MAERVSTELINRGESHPAQGRTSWHLAHRYGVLCSGGVSGSFAFAQLGYQPLMWVCAAIGLLGMVGLTWLIVND